MSPRIGSATSSNVEFGELEAERFDAPAPKKTAEPQSQSSQVEPWAGEKKPSFTEPAFTEAMNNGQELAAQSAKEASERKASLKALGGLEAPLMKLAQKFPDPLSVFGNVEFKRKDVAFGAFGDALRDEAFTDATAKLPARDVRSAVEAQVKKAWPDCSREDTDKLRNYFMRQVNENARERVAPRLQETATKMLGDAAKSFAAAAADPSEVKALAEKLNTMSAPNAESGRVAVRDLRAGLGLDPDQANVTPQEVAKALSDRAKLMHEESETMRKHDRPSLFRALADQDIGPIFMRANGIREDSLLAAQIGAVREEGEDDKKAIKRAKLVSVIAGAAVTGGMSLGPALAIGVSASMSAPSVAQAWLEVDGAKAAESAGTMKSGAGEDARRRAVIETGAAVVSIAGATAATSALHHATETLAAPFVEANADFIVKGLVHAATEGVAEETTSRIADLANEAIDGDDRASGQNALQRTASEKP